MINGILEGASEVGSMHTRFNLVEWDGELAYEDCIQIQRHALPFAVHSLPKTKISHKDIDPYRHIDRGFDLDLKE